MKRTYFILVLFLFKGLYAEVRDSSGMVLQEIRYSAAGAREVSLVWGMNGWQEVAKEFWPAGSYLKKDLLYTPMKKRDGYFSAWMLVPKNSSIDYVFWISKGFRNGITDLWDVNKLPDKDYHTLATQNNITLVESDLKAIPTKMLSILDLAIPISAISCSLLLLYLVVRKRKDHIPAETGYTNLIVSSSVMLFVFLLFIRPSVVGSAWEIYLDPLSNLGQLVKPALNDYIFVFLSFLFFWSIALGLHKYPRLQKLTAFTYTIFCVLFLLIGLLNIRVVESIGKPFTYQWLYYSDFLNSADAKAAIQANSDAFYALNLVLIALSASMLTYLLVSVNKIIWRTRIAKIGVLTGLNVISAIYLVYAGTSLTKEKWDINKLANPVMAFIESANPFTSAPELFTMEVPDSLQYRVEQKKINNPNPGTDKIKNVILFVLESTPAEYLAGYDSKYPATPQLSKYLENALIFKNIYAHAPATNNSMVSLLGSVYPCISCATLTQRDPAIPIPTLSSELKKKNYRTAFFNSADNRFQRAGEFLSYRKFDLIRDCRDQTQFKVEDKTWDFLNGNDDEKTAKDLMAWIEQDQEEAFFAMLWTYQTHYPYFCTEPQIDFNTRDAVFNRYLNAVHHSDEVFGKLVEFLKVKGLYESTLLVLVGDHGEAFGRHGQTTHASRIYEENLHVPCLLLNPAFKNKQYQNIGGLVDIAPTIMGLLKAPVPAGWQGKDLFTGDPADRVYFFSPWSDYLFGYREGKHKYIFNATQNITEIYDLEKDPFESNNLATTFPERIKKCHQRMAGWVQAVNHFMEGRLKKKY